MKKILTRVRKGNFSTNGVTPCHFVTPDRPVIGMGSEGTPSAPSVVIHRCFRRESAVSDALIEALYELLVDTAGSYRGDATAPSSAPTEATCFPGAPE
jgi:hypothetical protein